MEAVTSAIGRPDHLPTLASSIAFPLAAPAVEPLSDENIEMHDSALFDVVVEVDFYDGRRIWIPQTSTPPGWASPF
jgi:hypothetical protein